MLLTCGAAGCIEREHSLNGDVHGGNVEGFEHNLEQQGGKDRLKNTTASPGLRNAP